MAAYLSPVFGAGAQLFTNSGIVLSGGKVYTYVAGTTTPASTWTDSTQAVANANPIILDSAGRLSNEVWLQSGVVYKFILQDANSNVLGTWDNVTGINDVSISVSSVTEWTATALTPSYISATSFSVPGNNIATFQVHRRVQIAVTAGTIYGYVESSTFGGGITTVEIQTDSTVIDTGISSVNVGFLGATNPSVPQQFLAMNVPVTVASAATTPIGAAFSANVIVSGTVTITAFDTEIAGILKFLKFTGILTLTHNGTSLILPGSANITTANGDQAIFRSLGSGNWECIEYQIKALAPGNVNNATNATNVIGSGTISATTTGGTALTPTNATNATNATNVIGSGTISATTTGGGSLSVASAGTATNQSGGSVNATTGNFSSTVTIPTALTGLVRADAGVLSIGLANRYTAILATNAAWASNAATKTMFVICIGGGGAGGNGASSSGGGGGGGGGGSVAFATISSPSGTYNAVVGGAGGTSSFGSAISALGGTNGGNGTGGGGAGGTGGNTIVSTGVGGAGYSGGGTGTVPYVTTGGPGGAGNAGAGGGGAGGEPLFCYLHGAGSGGAGLLGSTSANGTAALANSGCGGGGGGGIASGGTGGTGGAGSSGVILVWEFE